MVFFLYSISIVLVASGGAAALYGAGNLRTESGTTLTLAGVAMCCAGLLMFALCACLVELRRIRKLVEEGEGSGQPLPFPVVQAPASALSPAPAAPAPAGAPAPLAPMTAAATAAAAAAAAAVALADGEKAKDDALARTALDPFAPKAPAPAPLDTSETGVSPPAEEAEEPAAWDPSRPAHDPAQGRRQPAWLADAMAGTADDPRPETNGNAREGAQEEALDAAVDHDPPAESSSPIPDEEPAPTQPRIALERTLVATYTSGENTYFMYSDGAIEADTPRGRFRFASMDELRSFVETGTGGEPLDQAAGSA